MSRHTVLSLIFFLGFCLGLAFPSLIIGGNYSAYFQAEFSGNCILAVLGQDSCGPLAALCAPGLLVSPSLICTGASLDINP